MTDLGKILIGLGGVLVIVGLLVVLGGKLHIPLGRLPGDIVYRGKSGSFYFPVVTCIVLSILLSFVLWLIGRFGR